VSCRLPRTLLVASVCRPRQPIFFSFLSYMWRTRGISSSNSAAAGPCEFGLADAVAEEVEGNHGRRGILHAAGPADRLPPPPHRLRGWADDPLRQPVFTSQQFLAARRKQPLFSFFLFSSSYVAIAVSFGWHVALRARRPGWRREAVLRVRARSARMQLVIYSVSSLSLYLFSSFA